MKSRWFAVLSVLVLGCGGGGEVIEGAAGFDDEFGDGKFDASAIAVFLEFEYAAELVTSSCYNVEAAIDEQALYTVGQLNGRKSVGRMDQMVVSNVEKETTEDGCRVRYNARMPVAWGDRNNIPEEYELILPVDVSRTGTERFVERYNPSCVYRWAHDVDAGVFWYYYRPERFNCTLDEKDVIRVPVRVGPTGTQTEGKYPEYHKVWEDETLTVVAIFGKAKDNGDNSDVGVRGYNQFTQKVRSTLSGADLTTEPAEIPNNPSLEMPYTRFIGQLPNGRTADVHVFLIESVTAAPSSFWEQYESLTPTADYIVYNGHSGLGQNVRRLASRGVWSPGQYSVVFMNGCDTYAYIDSALAKAHAEVNPDDPEGTKYLDIVANAMPSYFRSMPAATMAILNGLLDYENPKTYEDILRDIDPAEVALVTGEHDNVYYPGYVPEEPSPFEGEPEPSEEPVDAPSEESGDGGSPF